MSLPKYPSGLNLNDAVPHFHVIAPLIESSPYYYTRLESDRACVLGMAAAYLRQNEPSRVVDREGEPPAIAVAGDAFERSVAGSWCEPEHGAVLHRCPSRLASFAWRAHGLAQGMCQPPDDGHLAEWDRNLGGLVEAVHHVYDNKKNEHLFYPHLVMKPPPPHRRLMECQVDTFDGGFLTYGSVMEGVDIELADGQVVKNGIMQQMN